MEEKIRISIDNKNRTHIWINGKKLRHVTKIKFEVDTEKDIVPSLEIKKDFLPTQKVRIKETWHNNKQLVSREIFNLVV